MCIKCDSLGYTNEVINTTSVKKGKETFDDYEYGDVACDCEWGDAWGDRQDRMIIDYAYRMGGFIDKYKTTNRQPQALISAYLSGTRDYENTDGNL